MFNRTGTPLDGWSLGSRMRFAFVWTAFNALIVLGIMALGGSLSGQDLLLAIPILLLAFLANAWIWYPRVVRKHSPGMSSTRPS